MPRYIKYVEKISYEQELLDELQHFQESVAVYGQDPAYRQALESQIQSTEASLATYRREQELFNKGIRLNDLEVEDEESSDLVVMELCPQ